MSLQHTRPQDSPRSILQYQDLSCFNAGCEKNQDLKSCSRCKRVKYCSTSCQTEDFGVHKSFCKAFTAVRPYNLTTSSPYLLAHLVHDDGVVSPIGANERNMLMGRLTTEMDALVQRIGPYNMGKITNYLLYLEPRCLWCYRTKYNLNPGEQLVTCKKCGCATYCSDKHREKARATHREAVGEDGKTQCQTFQQCIQDDKFERFWSSLPDKPGDIILWAPERTLSVSTPSLPDLPESWETYFASTDCPYISQPSMLRTMLTISLSMPLTILSALNRLSISPSSIGLKMTVHVLGGTVDFEMNYGGMAFEELMHQMPWVQELVVVFIGPESGMQDAREIRMDCCPKCSGAGRKRTYAVSNQLYHDYAKKGHYTRPDIVVAFNSGLHEAPYLWEPTVKFLISKNLPSVFTSYNALEAREDAHHLKNMGADLIWSEERNKWSGGKAHFDYFTEGLFWYENGYVAGFRGSN